MIEIMTEIADRAKRRGRAPASTTRARPDPREAEGENRSLIEATGPEIEKLPAGQLEERTDTRAFAKPSRSSNPAKIIRLFQGFPSSRLKSFFAFFVMLQLPMRQNDGASGAGTSTISKTQIEFLSELVKMSRADLESVYRGSQAGELPVGNSKGRAIFSRARPPRYLSLRSRASAGREKYSLLTIL